MSPEQVQGKRVDARSDVFSFGSILYEMATGKRAFSGDTAPLLMASIVRDEPTPPHEILPSIPLELEKWILRALRKEPERRWQSMADFRVSLSELKQELDTGKTVAVVAGRPPSRSWLGSAAAAALAAGVLGWWALSRPDPLPPMRLVPLTSLPGHEREPAISPDGKQVAFTWRDEGADNFDLYVKLIDGGQELRLTETPEDEFKPAWSPDGTRIAFIRHVKDDNGELLDGVFVVSALGGPARPVTRCLSQRHGLSWSPDGNFLATVDKEARADPDAIYLVSTSSGEKRKLTEPPRDCAVEARLCGDASPVFSPDGKTVAFVRLSGKEYRIFQVPAQGGEPAPLTRKSVLAEDVAWSSDGAYLFFSDNPLFVFQTRLWRIPSSGGEAVALPITENAIGPTVSREGNRLVVAKDLSDTNIWRVGGPNAVEAAEPKMLIGSTQHEQSPAVSPDGRRIAFVSRRTGVPEIWVADSDGKDSRQLTCFGPEAVRSFRPQWSPDGRRIAFSLQTIHDLNIHSFVVPAEGGAPRRLTDWDELDGLPYWSRDGKWIYLESLRQSGNYQIWKTPSHGGDPIQVTSHGGDVARESPDGKFLFFSKIVQPGIFRIPVGGGEEELFIDSRGRWLLWDVYDEGICFVQTPAREKPLVMCYEFATGKARRLATLDRIPVWALSVSPDGNWIYYDQEDVSGSDLVLVENFR
jgi:Tol biopolymer transport system component